MYDLGQKDGTTSYGEFTIKYSLIKIDKDQLKEDVKKQLTETNRADDTEEVKRMKDSLYISQDFICRPT